MYIGIAQKKKNKKKKIESDNEKRKIQPHDCVDRFTLYKGFVVWSTKSCIFLRDCNI